MVRRDGAAIRKERISEIGRIVHSGLQKNDEISLSKTVALLQYDSGLTKGKILEYLEILETLGQFLIEKEQLTRIIKSFLDSVEKGQKLR